MKITTIKYYGGAQDKVSRLGLSHLFLELQQIIFSTQVYLQEKKMANGAAEIREKIDQSFEIAGDWTKKTVGDIDWVKRIRYNSSIISRIGVEVQVSARSDLLIRDLVHLRNNLQDGIIDVGVIIVPDNVLQEYLPDRTPSFKDAIRYIEEEFKEAAHFPIAVIAIEHDGPSDMPLRKRIRKS